MNLIAAADRTWGIGRNGDLLTRISRDMRYFSEMTTGHVIVMGRKTLESFPGGRPLPGRTNIVLTRDPDYNGKGAVVVHDMKELGKVISTMDDEIFVAGGGSIYRELLPFCSCAYITQIDREFEADTYMPDLDREPGWIRTREGEWQEENGIRFRFNEYENRNPQRLQG